MIYLYVPAHRDSYVEGTSLLGGVSALQGIDLTGPISFLNCCPTSSPR